MPSATLQAKIAAFESLANPLSSSSTSPSIVLVSNNPDTDTPDNLLETPISPTAATALPPVSQFTPSNRTTPRLPSPSPSPSPPNLGRRTSLIDLKDWVVEDGPSDSQPSYPFAKYSGYNGSNARKTSPRLTTPLISLDSPPKVKPKPKHLSSSPLPPPQDDPSLPLRKPSYSSLKSVSSSSSPQATNSSYLFPPRRNGVDQPYTYPPLRVDVDTRSVNSSNHVPASSISSFHSVSLSSDTDLSTPGSVTQHIASFPMEQDTDRDLSVNSVNSFGSDSISLDESYEEVSATSVPNSAIEHLIDLEWEQASAWQKQSKAITHTTSVGIRNLKPPPPPPPPSHTVSQASRSSPSLPAIKPSLSSSSATSVGSVPSPVLRRVPPPPSRSSDRSSILSSTTTDSNFSVNYPTYQPNRIKSTPPQTPTTARSSGPSQKIRRPTPVPPVARKRYEILFNANVVQRRKADKRQQAKKPALLFPPEMKRTRQGWRGLSIDLVTASDDHPMKNKSTEQPSADNDNDESMDQTVAHDDTLDGQIVRYIWLRSGLDKVKLREIWNEIDTSGRGCLDRDSFVKGMWRIDEELRRVHSEALKLANSTSLYAGRYHSGAKPVPPIPQKYKTILR